ncbi:MAG: NF038122 family metalloprotease [Caulobacteraceae bacterium]|nr:NF038122 family metalloprotease [Caulobacteraceae bacterium]
MYDPLSNALHGDSGALTPIYVGDHPPTQTESFANAVANLVDLGRGGHHELLAGGSAFGWRPPPQPAPAPSGGSGSPLSTLVGAATGLQIDLLWDASVRNAANWSAIESAVVSAAKLFTNAFTDHVTLNIAVGFGEVAGSAISGGSVGQSESLGYITGYQTVEQALSNADSAFLQSHGSSTGVLADQALASANFFVTSAEAKALGLISATAGGTDGYIGLSAAANLLWFPANGGTLGSGQYDAVGIAAHELSEVLGRMGMQGQSLGSYAHVYTALDLFRYSGPNSPALSPGGGYFSINGGASVLNTFNNPSNGGDSADWASSSANRSDAFDAFATPGVVDSLPTADFYAVAALGYHLSATTPAAITA